MFETEIKQLEKSYKFQTEDMFDDFENALKNLLAYNNPCCIPVMLRFLDDESEYPEMMYQIIHSVESFPLKIYLNKLLIALEKSYQRAPELTKTLVYGILNRPDAFLELKTQTQDTPDILYILKPILEDIAQDSPEHKSQCDDILRKIQ